MSSSVVTPFGTISANLTDLIGLIGRVGISVGGVAAIGLMTAGAFTILTSTGDPEKLMEGREMITNALMGLALIVLAMFVLQLLGWDILGLSDIRDLSSMGDNPSIPFSS